MDLPIGSSAIGSKETPRVSDFHTDLVVGSRRFVPFDDDETEARPASDAAPAAREGLPATYRMRAETHYVDDFASRSETGRPAPPAASEPPHADASAERTQR